MEDFTDKQIRQIQALMGEHRRGLSTMLDDLIERNAKLFTGNVPGRGRKRLMSQAERDQEQQLKNNTAAKKNNTDAVEDSSDALGDLSKQTKTTKERFVQWAGSFVRMAALTNRVNAALDDYSSNVSRGIDFQPLESLKSAMTISDFTQIQADYRNIALAQRGGAEQFTKSMQTNQMELTKFTGSMKASAILNADAMKYAQKAGVEYGKSTNTLSNQTVSTYKDMRKLGVSSDQFGQMLSSLSSNSDVQESLMKLGKRERLQRMQGLTQMALYYKTLGYSIEKSQELATYFDKMANKRPIDSLKESAKIQALGGAIGMGSEAGRLAELHRMGPQMLAQQGLMEEYEKLRANVSAKVMQGLGSQDIGTRLTMDTMVEKLGLRDMLISGNREGTAGTKARDENLVKNTSEMGGTLLTLRDYTKAIMGNSILQLAGVTAAILLLGRINTKLGKMSLMGFGNKITTNKGRDEVKGWASEKIPKGSMRHLKTIGKGLGKGLIGGLVALGANAVVDAAMSDENEAKGLVKAGVNGAALGATIGSFAGPLGLAIGGGVGGLLGAAFHQATTLTDKHLADMTDQEREIRDQVNKRSRKGRRELFASTSNAVTEPTPTGTPTVNGTKVKDPSLIATAATIESTQKSETNKSRGAGARSEYSSEYYTMKEQLQELREQSKITQKAFHDMLKELASHGRISQAQLETAIQSKEALDQQTVEIKKGSSTASTKRPTATYTVPS